MSRQLSQRPLPDMRRLSGDNFFMLQQDGTAAYRHATPSLSWSEREREMRETRRRLDARDRVRGTFLA